MLVPCLYGFEVAGVGISWFWLLFSTECSNSGSVDCFFLNWYMGVGVESNWVHSALRPQIGLLCQPWVIMKIEKLVGWWLARETEVLGENLPQCRFVHHKPHMPA
jgi:hypothetical protein